VILGWKKRYFYMMMGRGALVVDENLVKLIPSLREINIHVSTPRSGMKDKEIAEELLFNRIFVTNNTKDFLKYAPGLSIGIISLEGLKFIDSDKTHNNKTVDVISKAIIKHKIWSRKNGFYLELKEDGKHKFQEFA
jgi:hypothetical protein